MKRENTSLEATSYGRWWPQKARHFICYSYRADKRYLKKLDNLWSGQKAKTALWMWMPSEFRPPQYQDRNCVNCGKKYSSIHKGVLSCSLACGQAAYSKRKRVTASCSYCGLEMVGAPSQIRGKFCSPKCHSDSRRGVARPEWLRQKLRESSHNRGGSSVEHFKPQIKSLYQSGKSARVIACELKVKDGPVKTAIRQMGIKVIRPKPQLQKGYSRPGFDSLLSLAKKSQREAWSKEWAFLKCDEQSHWINHPEVGRWIRRVKARNQRRTKSNYYFSKILRSRIYSVLKGLKKSAPTLQLLGCSVEQFKAHLSARFTRAMKWENYGSYWEIDHIEPCASFDLSQADHQRRCFHFSNMQPLTVTQNRMKHARIIPLQRSLLV